MVRTSHSSSYMHLTLETRVDFERAAITATTRISNFNESNIPTLNIYTDASFQANKTTPCEYFIKEGWNKAWSQSLISRLRHIN